MRLGSSQRPSSLGTKPRGKARAEGRGQRVASLVEKASLEAPKLPVQRVLMEGVTWGCRRLQPSHRDALGMKAEIGGLIGSQGSEVPRP